MLIYLRLQQKEAKRNSRIIDPNEWMKSENETETKPKNNTNKEKLQKSLKTKGKLKKTQGT